jgi:hypothetical protein
VRKVLVTMLLLAPLLAGCGKDEEPLIPELKGRWDVLSYAKRQVQRASTAPQSVKADAKFDNCDASYVTFSKRGIAINVLGFPLARFPVTSARREGQRIILAVAFDQSARGQIELLMRSGELRFDDILDDTGRSIKYERLPDGNPMRQRGATTLGEGFQEFLDLKPCKV